MDHVQAQYIGGPAHGRRAPLTVGTSGTPATWLAVSSLTAPPDRSIAPRWMHRYEREPEPRAGTWRYHHRGPFA